MINKLSQCSVFLMFMCFGVSANGGLPTFSIAFSPTSIAPGGVSTLTYTLDNSAQITGATDLTFSNTLPTGMTVASPANAISYCTGGSYTATPGSNSISFSGARLSAGATCTFSIDVTSDAEEANYTNTTSDLTSSSGNSGPASDDLIVASSSLLVGLSFSPTTIVPNESTTLTYTLDGTRLTGNIFSMSMADTLSGLTVSDAPNVGGTCSAVVTAELGTSSIGISSGTLTAGDSCTITVDVTGDTVATYSNDIENFYYFESGAGWNYDPTTNAASVTIDLPIMYAAFTGFSSPGTSASLTYTISNFQRSDITNLSFANDLDATLSGLAATVLPANDFCGAGSTLTGSSTLAISGVNLSSGDSCSFEVSVLIPSDAAAGTYTNTSSIINFDLDGSATTAAAISNTLLIQKAPVLSALFIDDPVNTGDDVTLRYVITNTDSVNDATAISFTQTINDTYSGMVIKTLPGTNSCGVGSSVTEYYDGANYRKVLVDNASLTAGGSCTFDVILTAPSGGTPGSFAFTTSGFSATVNGDLVYGAPASDNLVVIAAPALSLAIVENSVVPGGAVSAELTLNYSINGNADATDVAFSVDLDGALSGMTTTSAVQNNICGSGSSLSGTGTLNLSGASLSPGDSCTFSVILQLPNNTIPSTIVVTSSPVGATTAGQSVSSAAASDSFIISGLSMIQQFISIPALPGASIISRYTISNHANAPAATDILFSHNYSAVVSSLAATSLPDVDCGASSALSGSTFVIFTGGELLPGASCTFDVPLLIPAGATQGSYNSTTSVINATVNGSNTESDAAASLLTIEQLSVLLTTSEVSPTSVTPFSVSIFFSRDVVNFSASDLVVTNGAATNLQGSGQSYTADITPTADGSLTIDLPANSVDDAVDGSVQNPAATQLSLSYITTATVVTPSINISAPSINSSASGPVSYTVTYSDVDQVNLTSAAITLNTVGTTATATVTGGDTITPTVTFSDITGDGTLGFSISAGSARNSTELALAAGPSSTFLVDNTAPTLTITDVVAHSINSPFEATFTFSEDVTGFDVTDIVPTNAVLSNFNANSALLYTVTVTPSNDGSVTLNVPSGSVVDRVSLGNIAASHYQIEYDTTRPTVAIEGVTGPIASAFTATIRFSEDVSNFVIGDISAPSATLSNFTAVTASVYTVLVSPIAQGAVTLNIGTNSAIDAASNSNVAAPEYSVVYDSIPPSLTVFLPAQNAVDVSLQTQVTLTFSEVVFATASNNLIEIKNIVGDLVVHSIPADSSAVSITGNIATITLPSDLPERIDLYVTVAANAFEDASGNIFAGFSDKVTWRFTSLNLPPVISGTPATQVDEDANYSFIPTVTDVDVTDTATFSVTNQPSWASFDTATGELTGTPDNDDVGITSDIVITVTDIANVADSLTAFSITVTNTNDAPIITLDSTLSTDEDNNQTLSFTYTDVDGDTVSATVSVQATNGMASVTGTTVSYAPNANFFGSDSFTLTLTDNAGYTTTQVINVTVSSVNDDPSIIIDSTLSTDEDNNQTLSFTYTDVDGDTVSASVSTPASNGTASVTGTTVSYAPNANFFGADSFTLTLTDNAGYTTTQVITVTVSSVNDDPSITLDSTLITDEDNEQTLSFTYTDVDGDTVSASVSTPASNGTASVSGSTVSYVPNANFFGADGFTLTLTDNAGYTTTQVITVTVSSVNDAPSITLDSTLITDEDNEQILSFTYSDIDGDTVSARVSAQASNGEASVSGSTVSYVPNANFFGSDSFTLTLTDSAGYTTTQVISVTVNSVNDAVEAVKDSFEVDFNDANIYVLDVLSNDSDIDGDKLYITGANTSSGSVTTDGASLTLTLPRGFFGEIELAYTIKDGNATFAGTKVKVLIKGDLSESAPLITVPGMVEINARGLYTRVDLGVATAFNRQGKPLAVSLVGGQSVFRPGNHIAHWQATDPTTGLTTVASQQVMVHPIISLGKGQVAVEGKVASVDVILNGEAPRYPVIVALSVSGSVNGSDYNIESQQVTITSGIQASLLIDIVQDNVIEGNEILIVGLDGGNIGVNAGHVITIVETNVAPNISLSSSQNTEAREFVTSEGGFVTVQARVLDINDDNVSTQWLYDAGLNISEIDEHAIVLDPSELNPGVYPISLMVTDDGQGLLSTTQTLYIKVLDSLAMLTDADSDGDMIPDNEEGYGDSDQDGIPDFLDAIGECNVMPQQASTQNAFLVESEPGVCLRKGISLAGGETGGVKLTANDLESSVGMDDQFVFVGGVFDFIVSGLPQAGQNYRVVLPQNQPIPLGAVYRKYSEIFGWGNFIEDVNNQVYSAPGEAGYCPAPSDVLWSMGLTEGYWCVQLTIEDGGPNDNDGIANGTIVDPGGVAVVLTDNTMPVAKADIVRLKRNESLVIDVLANDIDVDDDNLSIGVATVTFGDVNFTADNKINYQSKADFVGLDTIVYTLSDGNGGSDSGSVSITVYANEAPIALSDSANTNDRTPITITVLSNDSDADEDNLTIVSATVDEGIVTINQGTTLTYTPDSNFSGIATISYTIDDGQGDKATAQVTVDVEAYQQVTVNNKAKGGSTGLMIIILTGVVLFRLGRRSLSKKRLVQVAVSLTAAASMNLAAAQPQWFIMGSIGQSQAKGTFSISGENEITSQIWDDRDTSYSVGGGLRYVDTSIMLSYEKLGEVTASYTGDVLEAESFHQELANTGPKLAQGVSLQGQYRVWQTETLSASLGFGVMAWNMAHTSKLNDSVISNDENGINVFYTAALTYPLTDNMQMSVKVTRYNLSINDVNNIALALSYHF